MNGAGTGIQISMMKIQKVATTQPVLRLGLTASTAVVVGTPNILATGTPVNVLFLAVTTTYLTTTTTALVSVWCVPVLNKI